MERHRKWPCLITWPWISNPSSCSAAFVAQIPLVIVKEMSISTLHYKLQKLFQSYTFPFSWAKTFCGGSNNRKKYFWRKLHLCTAGCRTCCHLALFPLVVSGDIFVGVKCSEKFFLEKCPPLQAAEVVAILHIFSSPLPTVQKSIQSCQKLMDFLFTALLCSQFKILFMRLELFSRSMYPPVQTCIHSVLVWSCTRIWSWYDPFFYGGGGVGWAGV